MQIGPLANAGGLAILSMMVVVVPMIMGIIYAFRPTEARLALMRPLSLAGLFSGLSGFCAGTINVLVNIANRPETLSDGRAVVGLAESIVPLFVGFGCLTVAWLCVALGFRRQPS